MTRVILNGAMAEEMGRREWVFDLTTPVELFHALEANTGRMFSFLHANGKSLYRFIVNGVDVVNADEFAFLTYKRLDTIEVVPVMAGAESSGMWMVIAGLAIIAIALFVPIAGGAVAGAAAGTSTSAAVSGWAAWFGAAAGTTTASFTTTLAFTIGLSLTLSGIAQLTQSPLNTDTNEAKRKASYIFDGAVNSMRQGNPVPIGFGLLRVGSQVISAGVRSVDVTEDEET